MNRRRAVVRNTGPTSASWSVCVCVARERERQEERESMKGGEAVMKLKKQVSSSSRYEHREDTIGWCCSLYVYTTNKMRMN